MTPDAAIPAALPSAARALTGAERMRLHRERKRQRLRCLMIELRDGEIEGLIQRGWLARERRKDVVAIRRALYNYLSDNLGDAQWARPKPMVTRNVRIEA
jgi:hypothetical protein